MSRKINVPEVLQKIKIVVCLNRNYVVSHHVIEYMEKGVCSRSDIEYCLQNATTIQGITRDDRKDSVDGLIYTIRGASRIGTPFYTTGKFKRTVNGDEFYFFITAHESEEE